MTNFLTTAERLLVLPDKHRVLLAEYDYFPAHDLLYVQWHGHITAATMVQGAQAGIDLFRARPIPQRILSNHQSTTGGWEEAIPWLHYEFLPQLVAGGTKLLVHVLSADERNEQEKTLERQEFSAALRQNMRARSVRNSLLAWQWATARR